MLSSSNYIYLEEHNKFETYDHTHHLNAKKQSAHEFVRSSSLISPNMNKLLEAPIIGHLEDEEQKEGNILMVDEFFYDEDKENSSFFSNRQYDHIAQSHPEDSIYQGDYITSNNNNSSFNSNKAPKQS